MHNEYLICFNKLVNANIANCDDNLKNLFEKNYRNFSLY